MAEKLVTASSDTRHTTPNKRFRDRLTLPLLLLLTMIAGALRFVSLDKPTIWGDEALTFGRVNGTYQELIEQLSDSAFTPLHYEIEWWIGQGLPYWGTFAPPPADLNAKPVFTPTRRIVEGGILLTPFALRFVPALAGSLFVPAIFFLAVQLFGRRVALTAAFLACFSAYMLVYSRDAKMYMHFWLALTLHIACALWWMRSRRPTAWALWVLFGAAMVGLHASGFYAMLIDAVIIFTSPRQHWRQLFSLAGLNAWPIVVLPAWVYELVRRARGWSERVRWIRFLIWPRQAWRRFRWPVVVGFVIGAALMAAGPVGYYLNFNQKYQRLAEETSGPIDPGDLGIDWVGKYNADRGLGGHLLYTASAYLTGWEWPRHYPELKADPAAMRARQYNEWIAPLDEQANVQPRTLRLLQAGTVGLLTLLAIGVIPWRRAFAPVRARLDRIRQDGRVAAPTRSRRVLWLAIWLTALPWGIYSQSFARPANVFDGAAALLLQSPPDVVWPRAVAHKSPTTPHAQITTASALDEEPATEPSRIVSLCRSTLEGIEATGNATAASWHAVTLATSEVKSAWPAAWKAYAAAWRRDNLNRVSIAAVSAVVFAMFVLVIWKRRFIGRGAMRLAGVVLVLLLVGTVMNVLPRWVDGNVWMPRYLGAILPAVFVFVAVLIDRQPRRLRWMTLGLFVVVNLTQFSARVWGNSEPPTGLIAADIVASQPRSIMPSQPDKPTFRAYVDFIGRQNPEPGGATSIYTAPGRYYLRLLSGVQAPTRQVRLGGYEQNLQIKYLTAPMPAAMLIEADLKNAPEVQRFVVWTTLDTGTVDQTDPIADKLKGRFKRTNEEIWQARDHWRWYDRWQVRRRTYERIAPPTTQP